MQRATTQELLQYGALFAAYVAALHTVDGPWERWSKGEVIDNWWLTHIAWGYLGARMNQSLGQQMALTAANEAAEAWARRYRPDWTWGTHESPANVTMDFVANALGWYIGRYQR